MADLGTLGGSSSAATAINHAGDVVGSSATATGQNHAFLWTPSRGMVDLAIGSSVSGAADINDVGQVVGFAAYSCHIVIERSICVSRGLLWTPGSGAVDLGTLGGDYTQARAFLTCT
jgi:probable HAF family extracellular repeat protein